MRLRRPRQRDEAGSACTPVAMEASVRTSMAPVVLMAAVAPLSCAQTDTKSCLLHTWHEVQRYRLTPRTDHPGDDAREMLKEDLLEELGDVQTADVIPALFYLYACHITDGITTDMLAAALGSAAYRHSSCFGDFLSVMPEATQLGVMDLIAYDMGIDYRAAAKLPTGADVAKQMLESITHTPRDRFGEWPRDRAREFLLHYLTVAPSAQSSPVSGDPTGRTSPRWAATRSSPTCPDSEATDLTR